MNRNSPRKENPFDDFPKTYAYNSSMDMTFTITGLERFRDWREKWKRYIEDMLYVADQAIKWGYVEVHEGTPTTFTVHCPTSKEDSE